MNLNRVKICERMEQILREYDVEYIIKEEGSLLKITLREPYAGKIYIGSNTMELYGELMPNGCFLKMISVARTEFRLIPNWSFERIVFFKEDHTLEEQLAKVIDHVLIDNRMNTRVKHVEYDDLESSVTLTHN